MPDRAVNETPLMLPGWYGKLPSLGDFASRRLDPTWIDFWDHWLASGMLELRERLGDTWLDIYLDSPSWCFLLMPGVLPRVLGDRAWAGVVMPSVDRGGRYFPFTIAYPLDVVPNSAHQMQALWQWIGRLDELAADALQEDWDIARLEHELLHLAAPDLRQTSAGFSAAHLASGLAAGAMCEVLLSGRIDPAAYVSTEAHELWCQSAVGLGYWFAFGDSVSRPLRISRGLPANAAALWG